MRDRKIRSNDLEIDSFTDSVFSMLDNDETIKKPTFVKKEGSARTLEYLMNCKRELRKAVAFNERQRSHK